jgi:hypothetical protein
MVVFGGRDATGARNDAWSLTLSGNLVWSEIVPSGNAPPGRYQHAAILDLVRDRMVVFGGLAANALNGETWALSFSNDPSWRSLTPAEEPPSDIIPGPNAPSPRRNPAAIYDPNGDRMLVFGGIDFISRNDTWSLDWSAPPTLSVSLSPSVLWPPNRKLVSVHATVNTDGDEVALTSVTSDEPDSSTSPSDVPQDIQGATIGAADYDFQLRAERVVPGDGRTYTVCYEARNSAGATTQCEQVSVPISVQGRAGLGISGGSWVLTCFGDASMSVRNIVTTSVSVANEGMDQIRSANGAAEFADVDGDGNEDARFTIAFDPMQGGIAPTDVHYAWWQAGEQFYLANANTTPLGVDDANPRFLKASISNPVRGRAWIRYALPHADRVRLTIFDTMGRQVARVVDGWREAGWHTVSFDGGRPSQVYLYRLEWKDKSVNGKFAVLK